MGVGIGKIEPSEVMSSLDTLGDITQKSRRNSSVLRSNDFTLANDDGDFKLDTGLLHATIL
jgi:hypothetical protein